MSRDQCYPLPQVYLVDGGGEMQRSGQPPNLVPCWAFPPAQDRVRSSGKSRGVMGISPCLAVVVLLMFLLVFAALGFEAYQIYNIQAEMREMTQAEPVSEFVAAEKQIGGYDPEMTAELKETRTAAHLIGRIETVIFPKTLRWESRLVPAFISGKVKYLMEDGGLQVNKTGLYHIYTRVEMIFRHCTPTSSYIHNVFVRRPGSTVPLTLMEAHRAGFCTHQPNSWTAESYLGSTVNLQENDRVYVNVSHPQFQSHAHYGNFFGLYEI